MATLKEILKDKAQYADNVVFNFPGGASATLGELREMSSAEQTRLSKAEADANTAKAKYEHDTQQLFAAQNNTANLFTKVQAAVEAIKKGDMSVFANDREMQAIFGEMTGNTAARQPDDPFAALSRLENDNILGPVVKANKVLLDRLNQKDNEFKALLDTTRKMGERYVNDRLTDIYEKVVPEAAQAKLPLESLIQHAIRNNLLTGSSLPDVKKAYRELTAGDTAAANEVKIREDERKKVMDEINAKNIGILTPSSSGGGGRLGLEVTTGGKSSSYANLEEALAAAAKDPEIWSTGGTGLA